MVGELRPKNAVLAALPFSDWQQVDRVSEVVPLPSGHTLVEAGRPYRFVYFPMSGIVSSSFVYHSGTHAEFAIIGREGLVGLGPVFGCTTAICDEIVQIEGAAYAIPLHDFMALTQKLPDLRARVLEYAHAFLGQAMLRSGCGRVHSVKERTARWLLMCRDRTDSDELLITQQTLALLLASSREAINAAMRELQQRGAIEYRYGVIKIVDRTMLEGESCECYRLIQRTYEQALLR